MRIHASWGLGNENTRQWGAVRSPEEIFSGFLLCQDDLLIFYAQHPHWDEAKFLDGIGQKCYFPPLRLEDGTEGTFLETCFRVTSGNRIRHWLKNENVPGQEPKTWRYAHYRSHGPFQQKQSVMMATLQKVQAPWARPRV